MNTVVDHNTCDMPTPNTPPVSRHLRQRAKRLLSVEIEFIDSKSFHSKDAADQLLGNHPSVDLGQKTAHSIPASLKSLPSHLARLCETGLLSASEERQFFTQMNYLKFRANALRSTLDPENPRSADVQAVEKMLLRARAIRDHIVAANIRLVMSIAKKYVTARMSFDDLLSDGICALMQAVEKFDGERGFRFSTYAYRAITRGCRRSVTDRQKAEERVSYSADPAIFEVEDENAPSSLDEKTWNRLRTRLNSMLRKLDARERFIIRRRFALGAHQKTSTFQSLADQLGISKERVRQLQHRALTKLQDLAGEKAVDDLLSDHSS